MNTPSFKKPAKRHSSVLLDRFQSIMDMNLPQLAIFAAVANNISKYIDPKGQTRLKLTKRYGDKTIIAMTLGLDKFNQIDDCIEFDEHCELATVMNRREEQINCLCQFIDTYYKLIGTEAPLDLVSRCSQLVELLQPTSRVEDHYPAAYFDLLQRVKSENVVGIFNEIYSQLQKALQGDILLTHEILSQTAALIALSNDSNIPRRLLDNLKWKLMREDLGTAAVKFANSGSMAKESRAAAVLKTLWESGHEYAGLQLAQMFAGRLTANRLDLKYANRVIDSIEVQMLNSSFIVSSEAWEEFIHTNLAIKLQMIGASDENEELLILTKEMIRMMECGALKRLEGFAAAYVSFVAPGFARANGFTDNQPYLSARNKVSHIEEVENFCKLIALHPAYLQIQKRFV